MLSMFARLPARLGFSATIKTKGNDILLKEFSNLVKENKFDFRFSMRKRWKEGETKGFLFPLQINTSKDLPVSAQRITRVQS